MEIKLKKLSIQNFKGITQFDLAATSDNVNVYGANASGKTTIADAFYWVLFGKNSEGASVFEIKPINTDGSPKHNLETIVELELSVDGLVRTFKKVFTEVYTKNRATSNLEFSGHTVDHFVDGTPSKLKDYQLAVFSIVQEDQFKMLTDVYQFNTLAWGKQLEILKKLAKEPSTEEMLAKNIKFASLADDLKVKGIKDVVKTTQFEISQANKELDRMPGKISELKGQLDPQLDGYDTIELQGKASGIQSRINSLVVTDDTSTRIREIDSQIRTLSMRIQEFKNWVDVERSSKIRDLSVELSNAIRLVDDYKSQMDKQEREIAYKNQQIEQCNKQKEVLYIKYDDVAEQKFTASKCSYCGQALPEDKIAELQKGFNLAKSHEMEDIRIQGLEINKQIKNIETEIAEIKLKKDKYAYSLIDAEQDYSSKQAKLNTMQSTPSVNPHLDEITSMETEIASLQSDRNQLVSGVSVVNPIIAERTSLQSALQNIYGLIGKLQAQESIVKRIAETEAEEKRLGTLVLEKATKLSLCLEYDVAQSTVVQDQVNSFFEVVKFKFFDVQVNGEPVATCVATVDGVPFASLNHASKVNAGLDIIRSLQKITGINAPIFIDSAGEITHYIDLPSTQTIKLYVSESDKTLRVENI